ncbi:MAG: NUDIX hydrolase [Desulfobacteraceae bacterium]
MNIKYCCQCGAGMENRIPESDDQPRPVCPVCGFIHYLNPKMVVGCIPEWGREILLCRRNIEPCTGKWTLPAGYLENGETVQQGALRETQEETGATVDLIDPFIMYNIVFVNQIYLLFRAQLKDKSFGPTPESSEVRLFREDNIPWDLLAFPVIEQTLIRYFEDRRKGGFPFRIGEIKKGI